MAAVVSGNSLGLLNTSLYVLGSQAGLGQASQGRAGEQVYVNAATGNLVVQNRDELVVGRGPDLGLLRTYNSQGQFTDDNGDNWRLGFYRTVYNLTGTVNTAGSTVTRVAEDGSESVYSFDAGSGKYLSQAGAGAYDTLAYNAASQAWTWTDGNTRAAESYDGANGGRLVQVLDPDGNGLTLTYNAAGLITQVSDADGETTFLDYSGTNLAQLRTVNASGQTLVRTRYSYDASNRLTQVITDLSPQDASVADGNAYTVSYTYDGTSRRVTTMTQSDGTSVAFTYALVGSGYRVATVTDALGQVTSFSYNTTANTTTVTDALGLATVLAYDASGQLTGVTGPAVNGVSQTASYTYDSLGNVTSVTDAKGNVVTYQYDANGNRVLERDAVGNTVTRVFGASNQLLAQTVYVVPDPDGAGAGQPGAPLTSRYAYDANNHLRFVVSADGKVSEYRYNGLGQQVAVIQYAGARYDVSTLTPTSTLTEAQLVAWLPADKSTTLRVDTAYDFRGQVASVTSYAKVDALGNGVADGTQSVTQFVYDQFGNLLTKIDPRGVASAAPADYTTSYTYDGMARVLSSTNALGVTTVTQYDDADRKTIVTLSNGLINTSTYDAAGRLVSVLQSKSTGALGETKYFYDADGRLRRSVDPTGVASHVLYDEAGRKVADIDGNGSLTEYRYDADNNLTKTIRYATAVSATALASLVDANGNPTNVTLASVRPAATPGADRVSFAAYDAANRLVKTVDPAGDVTQTFYDGAGRATDVIRYATPIATATLTDSPAPSAIAPTASAADRLTRTFYDADGKMRGTLDAEGYLVEYKYDAAGELVETVGYATATNATLRTTGTLAQLIPAASSADIHSYSLYNARGQLAGTVDGEGYLTEYVYDAAGNQTQSIRYATKVTYSAGATVASLRPAASAQDQTTRATYTALNQVASRTGVDGTVTQYTYSDQNLLVKTVKAAGTSGARGLLAQYDKRGRMTAQLSANGVALLNGAQTQAGIDAIWAAYAAHYTYDAAGRKTSATDADGHKTLYYYNVDGQLTHTINALGEVSESDYNALGQLVQTIQYGTRLSAATLATLSGGLVNITLTTALAAIANAGVDSKTSYAYTNTGKLAQTTDALGNAVTQAFNAFGEVTASSQAIGGGLTLDHTYAYDRRGLLTQSAIDPTGANAVTSTVYDAFGRATQTTDARGNVRSATYDRLGRTVTTTNALGAIASTSYDAFGRVLTKIDALGKVTTYAYDTANRAVTVTTPEGISTTTVSNRHGQTISVTDGRGNTTAFQYDDDGNLLRTDSPSGSTTATYDNADLLVQSTNALGVKTTYVYDAVNRQLTRTVDAGTGRLNLVTTYAYDAKGQSVATTDANGVVTQTTFDLKGQVASVVVDPGTGHLNLTTTYTYDARGKKLTVTEGAGSANPRLTQYAYDKLGRLISERVDPNGINATTTYAYNRNNSVVKKTDANGNVTRYTYDANDRLMFTVNALGGVTKNEYDANGHVTKIVNFANAISLTGLPDPALSSDVGARLVSSAMDEIKNYVYNGDGQEIYCVDAMGDVTQKSYDGSGNVVRTVVYATPVAAGTAMTRAGIAAALVASANDRITRTVYDAANRAVYAIDAGNYVKETQYDAAGRVTKTIRYTQTIAVGNTPTVAQVAAALQPDPGKEVNTFNYDAAGRMVLSVDGEGFTESFTYDAVGNKLSFTNEKGVTWNYVYDAAGRMTSEISPQVDGTGVSATAVPTVWTDDALPAGATAASDGGDAWTWVSTNPAPQSGTVAHQSAIALGEHQQYFYNATSTLQVNAGDTLYAWVYLDPANPPSEVMLQWNDGSWEHRAYWGANNIGWGTDGTASRRYMGALPATGGWVRLEVPAGYVGLEGHTLNGMAFTLYGGRATWDNAGKLSIGATQTTARIETRMTYDALGNVLSRTEAYGRPEARTTQYRYDALGRQTTTLFPTVNVYSAAGDNLTTNGIGGVVTPVETAATPQTTTTYDTVGNAVVGRDAAGNYSYKVYDSLRRVKYEIDAEHYVTENTYDAFGNKVSVTRYATALDFGAITGYAAHADGTAFAIAEVQARLAPGSSDRVITTVYDTLNRAAQVTQPAVYTFDSSATGANPQYFTVGATTRNTYNAFGQVVKQSVLRNPGVDLLVGTADDTWIDTYYYYDARGKEIATVDPLGYLTIAQYDAAGNMVRQVEYARALAAGTWNVTGYAAPTITTPQSAPGSAIGYDRETTYQYDRKNQKIAETKVNAEFGTLTGTLTLGTAVGNLTTTYAYDGVGNVAATTDPTGATTYTYYDALGRTVATAAPARFSDGGNGVVVMPPVYVNYDSASNSTTLSFANNAPTGTTVVFQYEVVGAASWTTAALSIQGTNFTANLTGLPTDRYQYQITYTKPGATTPYATGTGQFSLVGPSSATASVNVAAVVEQPSFSINGVTANAHYDFVAGSEGGYVPVWNGANAVSLSWNSMDDLGTGNIHVRINYLTNLFSGSGSSPSGTGIHTSIDNVFSASAASGATVTWTDAEGAYAGVASIDSIQVWKVVNGQEILVINSASSYVQSDRLLIRGNTTGLTGINVAGVGTLAASALGAGVYTVSLAGLDRGSYSFTPVGTASAVGGTFDVLHSPAPGNAGLQEINPTSVNRTINAFHLPAAVASVVLQYRPSGNTGPFLSKVMNALGSGEFAVSYDDIANGSYDYILTARDASGNVVSLTGVGGTASGTLSGTILVRRGGLLPSVTADPNALTVTPLTVTRYDAFGDAVVTTKYANGALNADTSGYGIPWTDPNDETTYDFYDGSGHVIRSVDPMGASSYRSYDVLGNVAKTWQPITNNDGQVNNAVQVLQYDRLGHQVATIEPSYLYYQPGVPLNPASYATNQVTYDAFGEITSRGLNGGAQEYDQYDNAGHLWRTNEKDGVDKVMLYDLQSKNTAQIVSQGLDLRNGYSTPAQVAALASGVQRTNSIYDADGHMLQQVQPSFAIERDGLQIYPTGLSMTNASLSVAGYTYAHYDVVGYDEWGNPSYSWNPTTAISLSWNDISNMGGGNVYVYVDYITAAGTAGAYAQEFSSASAATGVYMSWQDFDGGWGAGYAYRIRVWKRDVNNNLIPLYDQGGSGSFSNQITSVVPPEVGAGVTANYKAASATTWTPIAIYNMGSSYVVSTLGWGAGTYDLEVLYKHPDETTPYAHSTGRFANAGGGIADTTAATTVSFQTYTPTMTQTVDRWGNALSVTDARGYTTNYRYNFLNKLVEEDDPLTDVWGANGVDTVMRPVKRNFYDKMGRGLGTIDANGNPNAARYDAAGQLVNEYHADGGVVTYLYDVFGRRTRVIDALGKFTDSAYDRDDRLVKVTHPIGIETYVYDEAGNRIRSTDALGLVIRYWYDTRGKVVKTQLPGGQVSSSSYDLRGNKIKDVTANGDQPVWSYDYFGHLLSHTDMGNGTYTYAYDEAGHVSQQTLVRGGVTAVTSYQYYENGLVKRITDGGVGGETFYEYDAAGNRTRERYVKGGIVYRDDRTTFDELGRVKSVRDNRLQPILYKYDANGNRRNVDSTYYDGTNTQQHVISWYLYDSMNRITLSQGVLLNGVIQINQINPNQGIQLQYDAASNRRVATNYQGGALVTESYNYDDDGRLTTTNRGGQLTSSRTYDLDGRATVQISFSSPGTVNEERDNTYDLNGRLTQQQVKDGAGTVTQATVYDAYDAMGNVLTYHISVYTGTNYTNTYNYSYAKFDSYKEQNVAGTSTLLQPGNTTTTYDINGNILSVTDQFGANKNRTFVTDGTGQIIQKTENGSTQYYFYQNDKPIGSSGALSAADFDYNYTPVSNQYPGTVPGSYVVSKGDTLRSIALALFGDAQLWYVIADANGMHSDSDLKIGQQLTIPNKITNLHNDSTTFKVYNASEIIGDTTPTLPDPPPPPPPPHKKGCGIIGTIIVVIVAIVVTYFTAGLLGPVVGPIAAGMIGAAAGSIASQGVAMAMGMQDKFNWGAVGVAALTAGITQGVGVSGWAPTDSTIANQVIQGAAQNAIGQGVAIAVGQQDKFDWRGFAAAAVSAPITASITKSMNETTVDGVPVSDYASPSDIDSIQNPTVGTVASDAFGEFGGRVATGIATGIATAAVKEVFYNGKLDAQSVLGDVFGNALGNAIVGTYAAYQQAQAMKRLEMMNAITYALTHPNPAPADTAAEAQDPNTEVAAKTQPPAGAAAVLRGLEYAGEAGDARPTTVADVGGHTYLPLLIAQALDISSDRLARIIAYSQFPDQISALDATTNGVRDYLASKGYDPAVVGVLSERALHSLNGMPMTDSLQFYQQLIADNRDNDAVVGLALHGLVDAVFHSHDVNGVATDFDAPLGHFWEGHDQDYIKYTSRDQITVATSQVMTAFETVAGTTLTDDQRANVYSTLNAALDRAAARTTDDLRFYDQLEGGSYVNPNERMEMNFRDVVRNMLPSGSPGVNIQDIQGPAFHGMITEDSTLAEGRTFFNNMPPDQADALTKQGMAAAITIMQAYNDQFGDQTVQGPIQQDGLYDTKVWSLRKFFPSFSWPTSPQWVPPMIYGPI